MKKRQQRLPTAAITTKIEKFSHEGRGIARIEGKTTFIQGALADETVTFQYTRKKSDFDEGRLLTVITPSPHRVEPVCEHYSMCGGCSLQHLQGAQQIHEKQKLFLDVLARTGHVQPQKILEPLVAELWHYRNKARLSVRYVEKKQATLVGFREKNNSRYITEIKQCSILNARIGKEIGRLRQLIDGFAAPQSIAQIEIAAGDDALALIFRNLSPLTPNDEQLLRQFANETSFRIYLQPSGPDSVYLFYPERGSDFLSYSLPAENITFQFHPTDFTQVNAGLNRAMVTHAMHLLALEPQDIVLDLFCGLGNFSLPIAKHCAQVIGVEGSETMVARATMNAAANGLNNAQFFCANLEDASALRQFTAHQCNKILLDPPRVGAMEIVKHIDAINPQRIVYVSCNPVTLARDADILVNQHGYQMLAGGVMDMFPHTAHVESIALFQKGP